MPDFSQINRRDFLARSAAIVAAASAPVGSFAQETMRTRRIPGTDEYLPVIGLGAPRIFIDLPPEGDELPKSVLQTMVDLGGRLLDTPAFFRPDVPVIGKFLTEMGLQQKLFLSGKITVNGKPHRLEGPVNLRQILEGLSLPSLESGVAVAVNGELVRRDDWEGRVVQAEDRLEIVSATQGG